MTLEGIFEWITGFVTEDSPISHDHSKHLPCGEEAEPRGDSVIETPRKIRSGERAELMGIKK